MAEPDYCTACSGGEAINLRRTGGARRTDRHRAEELGFLRPQRIAVVLPNGPELATAFVSISTVAGFAPLNPAYALPEFRFYLEDLQASAVITIPGLSRGERVCAAVVLDGDATEIELKRFARERLAAFKAPARVLIVSEIPKDQLARCSGPAWL